MPLKLALISCGRSDYSIYYPLIKALNKDKDFDLDIIAFGTHVSVFHGHTVDMFAEDGFEVAHRVESLVLGDSPEAISTAIGLTTIKFSSLWANNKYDLIIVMGDRYEMFAAISASVPFNIPIAHIHGGETTLGAIDDKFRHAITIMSTYHFTSTEGHAKRVKKITGSDKNIFNVGALSLDNLEEIKLLSIEEFKDKYGIDMSVPTILCTFHPETVSFEKNIEYTDELIDALKSIEDRQIIITMPNADTMGTKIREKLQRFADDSSNVFAVENLGRTGYFSCMKHCEFLLGNTSSGIIEAASFGKYVINIGDRQRGRETGDNVLHVPVNKKAIMSAVDGLASKSSLSGNNVYGKGNAVDKITSVLKKEFVK